MLNALPSFAEKPILASIIEVEDENGNKTLDFNGHDRIITEDKLNSEEKRVEYIEQIVGVIPANNNIQLLADNENETKKYVWVDGLIFNEYTYAPDIIKKRGTVDVSVELNVKKFSYNVENDYLSIDEFTFFGVTLLGAHVKPGMKGSMLQQYSNNKNEAKTYDFDMSSVVNHMYSLLQRIDATNEEGGESNLKLSELLKKYNKTQEELTFSVEGLSDEELENAFELEFGKQDDTENQIVFELSHDDIRMALYTLLKNSVEEEDYYSVWIMEVFDKYFIYQDYDKNKYFKQMYTKDNDVVEFNGDAEGLVEVRQGSGTRVLNHKAIQNYNKVTSVTESLMKKGYRVTTSDMMIDIISADKQLADELEIPEGTSVARIQRLQLADEEPVTLMENYIEYAKVPGIEAYENQFVALYQFLEEKFGLQIDETRDRISAKSATFMEAQVLKTEPKDALLVVHRVTYWQNRPVSIDHVRIIGSKYEVEISGKGRSK